MWRKIIIFLGIAFPVVIHAEQTKLLYSPFTGKLDYITKLDSTTLPSGSTQYIQNTLTPTTTTQRFSVQVGSFSVAGWYIMDSDDCLWNTTINTSGVLTTALMNCPSIGFIIMEDNSFVLQEDATFIPVE